MSDVAQGTEDVEYYPMAEDEYDPLTGCAHESAVVEQTYYTEEETYYASGGEPYYEPAAAAAPQYAEAPAPAPAPAQMQAAAAPERRPLQPQVAAAPAPAPVASPTQLKPSTTHAQPPVAANRLSVSADTATFRVRLPLLFRGRQRDLETPSVNTVTLTKERLQKALTRAVQQLRPGERAVGIPKLDLSHAFICKIELLQEHNTFHKEFVVVCVSHPRMNGMHGDPFDFMFYVPEGMGSSYPRLELQNMCHHLADPLFQSVAGNTIQRLVADPNVRVADAAIYGPGMVMVITPSPLAFTIMDEANTLKLQEVVPSWDPSRARQVTDGPRGYTYVVMPLAVLEAAIKLYHKAHTAMVDIVNFDTNPLRFALKNVDGQGRLDEKDLVKLEPAHQGHVFALLELSIIFPISTMHEIAQATKVARTKKTSQRMELLKVLNAAINP